MSAALIVVGVSLVAILVITTVLALRRHERVHRERHEAPEDRYRRDVANIRHTASLRSAPRVWRRRRNTDVGSSWAAGMTSHGAVLSAWAAGQDGGSGGDSGGGDDC
jgi:hypothetical protein